MLTTVSAVRARGVWFETFLLAPTEILAACARPAIAVHACGLLPGQLDARDRAEIKAAIEELGEAALASIAAEAHCANGMWVEKLRHHAWPRRLKYAKPREVSGG